MFLSLSKLGPPMWFLGQAKNLIVSLNYLDPGPKEVDFNELSIQDKKIVILAVRSGHITSDISEEKLIEVYKKELEALQSKVQERETNGPKETRANSLLEKAKQEAKALEEYCSELAQQPLKIINEVVLEKSADFKFLRTLLQIEEKQKNRTSLKNLIKKCQKQNTKLIKQNIKETRSTNMPKSNTKIDKLESALVKSVIESEEVEVELTEEEFRALAEGKSLG